MSELERPMPPPPPQFAPLSLSPSQPLTPPPSLSPGCFHRMLYIVL